MYVFLLSRTQARNYHELPDLFLLRPRLLQKPCANAKNIEVRYGTVRWLDNECEVDDDEDGVDDAVDDVADDGDEADGDIRIIRINCNRAGV